MWSAYIPQTPATEIDAAIDACETEPAKVAEQRPEHLRQLEAARKAAHDLVAAGVVAGDSFEVTMGGHADPGDASTQADYIHVQVSMTPRETIHEAAEREAHETAEREALVESTPTEIPQEA